MAGRVKVIMAIGSNHNQEENMETAKTLLRGIFGQNIVFTDTVWTEPVGIQSDMFKNCLAFAYTAHTVSQVERALKYIEKSCGDRRNARRKNVVCMDIDLLQYDNQVFHEDDWERGYIRELMKSSPF